MTGHPARRALDRPLQPLRPGGRWAKLLAALESGPRDTSELYDAVGEGRPRWRERRKIEVALCAMASLGLVQATHWGWARTADGGRALAELPPADPSAPAAPETETA